MTNLTPPPVPELSSDWIAARRDRLVREITTPHRQPVSRRLAVRGVGALAGGRRGHRGRSRRVRRDGSG